MADISLVILLWQLSTYFSPEQNSSSVQVISKHKITPRPIVYITTDDREKRVLHHPAPQCITYGVFTDSLPTGEEPGPQVEQVGHAHDSTCVSMFEENPVTWNRFNNNNNNNKHPPPGASATQVLLCVTFNPCADGP